MQKVPFRSPLSGPSRIHTTFKKQKVGFRIILVEYPLTSNESLQRSKNIPRSDSGQPDIAQVYESNPSRGPFAQENDEKTICP